MKRGRPNALSRLESLRQDLRNLNDLVALEEGSLAKLDHFQRRAAEAYPGRTCSVGHAVADGLTEMLLQVADDLPGTPVAELARRLAERGTQIQAAALLRVSPQHLSRRYKPVLLLLLQQKLQALK